MKQQQIRRQPSRTERERRRARRNDTVIIAAPGDGAAVDAADSVLASIDAVLAETC